MDTIARPDTKHLTKAFFDTAYQVRSLAVKVIPIFLLDGFVTVCLLAGAAAKLGLFQYISLSFEHYTFRSSIIEVPFIVLIRIMVLLPIFWSLRSRNLSFGLQFLLISIPLTSTLYILSKTLLMMKYFSTEKIIGDSYLTFAFLDFGIFISFVELCAGIYAIYRDNVFQECGYTHLEDYNIIGGDVMRLERDLSINDVTDSHTTHSSLARLFSISIPEFPLLLFGLIGLLVSAASNLAMPGFFGIIMNDLNSHANKEERIEVLNRSIVVLLIIFIIGGVARFVKIFFIDLSGQRLVARLRKFTFASIMIQDIEFFDVSRTGDLTNRLSSDIEVLQLTVTNQLANTFEAIVQIIGALILLFISSWKLTLVILGVVPAIVIISVVYMRFVEKISKEIQDLLAVASATAVEIFSSIRTVRSFTQEERMKENYSEEIEASYDAGKTYSIAYGVFIGLIAALAQGAIVVVVWYGSTLVLTDVMTPGDLISFLLYTLNIASSVGSLSTSVGNFFRATGASERVFEIIDKVPNIPREGGTIPLQITGDIKLKNISFSYATRSDKKVVDNLTLHIKPGEVVALVGPSGGGKTTIIGLLKRFYDPDEGTILLDDTSISELNPQWYQRQLALVSQEPQLFATTIKENICFSLTETPSMDTIIQAATLANAHDFIMNFPDGYETMVGERGIQLSGGQKQRIAIARALVLNPKVLLLDEATSALDADSEHLVQAAIDRAMENRTTLIIAHRLSTIRNANKVCVINGSIVEMGTHDELLKKNGTYRKLVQRQLVGDSLNYTDDFNSDEYGK